MNKIIYFFCILFLTSCIGQNKTDLNEEKKINAEDSTKNLDEINMPIDILFWKKTSVMYGRVATESDVKDGKAIFFLNEDKNHKFYDIDLPKLAYIKNLETNNKDLVVIIQAESSTNGVIIGYRNIDGRFGACLLEELEFLSENEINRIENKN